MENVKPQLGDIGVKHITSFLDEQAKKYHHVDVLEWGAGTSTVYFSQWLKKEHISFSWTALEYDKEWFKKVMKLVEGIPEVEVHLFEPEGNPRSRDILMNEYVEFPSNKGEKYDLIIVDGRKRRRCILEAKSALKEGGIVLLHDAWRTRYFCAMHEYSESRFLSKSLWLGSNRPTPFYVSLKNRCNRHLYQVRGYIRQWIKHAKIRLSNVG